MCLGERERGKKRNSIVVYLQNINFKSMPTIFITDTAHYTTVLNLAAQAKRSLWIGTADIEEFDKVWRGSECEMCQRRGVCPDPIVG